MEHWRDQLEFDPLPQLVAAENPALRYFARRDLVGEDLGAVETLWDSPAVTRLVKRQQEDAAWEYPGGKRSAHSQRDYNQLQNFRVLGQLVEQYGLGRAAHPAIGKAAAFLFRSTHPPTVALSRRCSSRRGSRTTSGLSEALPGSCPFGTMMVDGRFRCERAVSG